MKSFSSDFIEQVRLANDIIALISEDTILKQKGSNYSGLCPFLDHTEKTPSFSVSPDKQLYHCFGCQKSGDIFTYLRDQRNMNFREAILYLANKARISIPEESFQDKKNINHSNLLFELNEEVCHFYHQQLFKKSTPVFVSEYLKKRNYSKEIIKEFHIGYAPSGNVLLKYLETPSKIQLAQSLGLLNKNKESVPYDTFRNRLIFPILSHHKKTIGFGARVLDNSLPKYINSRESAVFSKGKSFYGLNQSAKVLRLKNQALVVEGYTDFLSLWQKGIQNSVATLGTALTLDHARLLKRYVNSVVLLFDGDVAGMKAAERSLPILLEQGLEVKGIFLPEKQDPDTFIKQQGVEALNVLIRNSEDLFFYILQKNLKLIQKEGRKTIHLIAILAPFIQATQNPNLKFLYKQRILDLFGKDAKEVEKLLNEVCRSKPSSFQKFSAPSITSSSTLLKTTFPQNRFVLLKPALMAEKLLLVLCLHCENFLKEFLHQKALNLLKTKEIFNIFKKLDEDYRQKASHFDKLLPLMMNYISDNHLLLMESYPILKKAEADYEIIFQDCLSFLKNEKNYSQASELIAEMKMNPTKSKTDLQKIFELTKKRLSDQETNQETNQEMNKSNSKNSPKKENSKIFAKENTKLKIFNLKETINREEL